MSSLLCNPWLLIFSQNVRLIICSQNLSFSLSPFSPLTAYHISFFSLFLSLSLFSSFFLSLCFPLSFSFSLFLYLLSPLTAYLVSYPIAQFCMNWNCFFTCKVKEFKKVHHLLQLTTYYQLISYLSIIYMTIWE